MVLSNSGSGKLQHLLTWPEDVWGCIISGDAVRTTYCKSFLNLRYMTQMDMKFAMNAVNVGMSLGYIGFAVHLTVLASKCSSGVHKLYVRYWYRVLWPFNKRESRIGCYPKRMITLVMLTTQTRFKTFKLWWFKMLIGSYLWPTTVAKGAVPEVGICDVSFKVIHDCWYNDVLIGFFQWYNKNI